MTSDEFTQKYGFSLDYLKGPHNISTVISREDPSKPGTREIIHNSSSVNWKTMPAECDLLLNYFNSMEYLKDITEYKIYVDYNITILWVSDFQLEINSDYISLYRFRGGHSKKVLNPSRYQKLRQLHEDIQKVLNRFNEDSKEKLKQRICIDEYMKGPSSSGSSYLNMLRVHVNRDTFYKDTFL